MKYISTRGENNACSGAQTFIRGMAADGGLYVPGALEPMTASEWKAVCDMAYPVLAAWLMNRFFEDLDCQAIDRGVRDAYHPQNFDGTPIRLERPDAGLYFLELWHGPTCAFKDMSLQLMPRLFALAKQANGDTRRTLVLAATSGDTGKAALAGFANLAGFDIGVLYPNSGVSEIQRMQMVTQQGDNVAVSAIEGNFDEAQKAVKDIFGDRVFAKELAAKNVALSSANSINWGRLAPQIVYYLWSCAELTRRGDLKPGHLVDFCVPTGNFGNILAGFYARLLGAPIGKLICASNANHILTDFFESGVYDRNRDFFKTISPSMDILVSSNLERLLWQISGGDSATISAYMRDLVEKGRYEIDPAMLKELNAVFSAGWCPDDTAKETIRDYNVRCGYLMDPHTAVACRVVGQRQKSENLCVIVSTASPYKFPEDVLSALRLPAAKDPIAALHAATGVKIPKPLVGILDRAVRFSGVCAKENVKDWIRDWAWR